jgi:hypothetical protein
VRPATEEATTTRISLDDFVNTLDPARATVEMFSPSLHLETIDTVYDSGTVLWRADITMTHLDSRMGDPDVVVGQGDFVMARTGVEGLAQQLVDREEFHHLRTDRFAPLFDAHRIGPELAQQFSDCVEVVMIALWIVVDPPTAGCRTVRKGRVRRIALTEIARYTGARSRSPAARTGPQR